MIDYKKEFEETTEQAAWINSDIYPDGKIYTKSYTEWLEKKVDGCQSEITALKEEVERLKKQNSTFAKYIEGFRGTIDELSELRASNDRLVELGTKYTEVFTLSDGPPVDEVLKIKEDFLEALKAAKS